MATRPSGDLHRRMVAPPTDRGRLCLPTPRKNTPTSTEVDDGEDPSARDGNTELANSALVSRTDQSDNGAADLNHTEQQESGLPMQCSGDAQQIAPERFNCLDAVKSRLRQQGLDEKSIDLALFSGKVSTRKAVTSHLGTWSQWCLEHDPPLNPLHYDTTQLTNFLSAMQSRYAVTSIHAFKSSISTMWSLVHPNKPAASTDIRVSRVISHLNRQAPAKTRPDAWDMRTIFAGIRDFGEDNWQMSLPELTHKTYILLTFATAWRPSSDMARIQATHIRFQLHSDDDRAFGGNPLEMWPDSAHLRSVTFVGIGVKEGPSKQIMLDTFEEDESICPLCLYEANSGSSRGPPTRINIILVCMQTSHPHAATDTWQLDAQLSQRMRHRRKSPWGAWPGLLRSLTSWSSTRCSSPIGKLDI